MHIVMLVILGVLGGVLLTQQLPLVTALLLFMAGVFILAFMVCTATLAIKWIEDGGVKKWEDKAFVFYAPLALLLLCYVMPAASVNFATSTWAFMLLRDILGIAYGLGGITSFFIREQFEPGFKRFFALGVFMVLFTLGDIVYSIGKI